MNSNQGTLYIQPAKVAIVLGCIAGILVLINLIDQLNIFLLGIPMGLIPEFHLDSSNTIPSYFTASLLLFSSIMLGMIGVIKKNNQPSYSFYWFALAVIFFFVSIDKIVNFRKEIKLILLSYSNLDVGFVPSSIITITMLIVGLLTIRFLLHLSSKDRMLFLLATGLFIGGGVGMDFIGDRYGYLYGEFTLAYGVLTDIEVGLEMFGSVVFFYALLNYMSRHRININILK